MNSELSVSKQPNPSVWVVRIIWTMIALMAGYVFINYLINFPQISVIDFERELLVLRLFTALNNVNDSEFILQLVYMLSAISGCLASFLAVILALLVGDQPKSRNLAAALSLGSLALAYMTFVRPLEFESITSAVKLLDVVMAALWGLALWFWILFTVEFPKAIPLGVYIDSVQKRRAQSRFSFIPNKWRKKAATYDAKISNVIWDKSRSGTAHKSRVFQKFVNWLTSYQGALLLVVLMALTGVVQNNQIRDSFLADKLFLVFIMLNILVISITIEKIISLNPMLDETHRKQNSWLFLGVLLLAYVFCITWVIWILLLVFGFMPAGGHLMLIQFFLMPPVFWLVFLLALMVSIFYHGNIDPRLIIKQSTIYGIIGLGITTLFIAVEGMLSTQAVLQFGLHDQTAAIITGIITAVVFRPVRQKIESGVNSFINRILPVSALGEGKRRISAVVFNDLSSYTKISEENEDAALMLVSIIHQVGTKAALDFGGRVVKTIGDAIMLELPSADQALAAAKYLHERYLHLCHQYKLPLLPIHSGIHWGEVVRANDGDIYGKNVNLAARLEGVAGPSEIVISEAAYLQLSSTDNFSPLGGIELKNIAKPVQCFRFSTAVSV